jgi:CheY-like chemotaxis protein
MTDAPKLAQDPAKRRLQGLRILVVDDDDGARNVLRSVLESDGAVVFAASSAAAAQEEVDRTVPDVVLVDLSMPVVNGFTFLEQLRSRPATAGGLVPAAAITGYLSGEDRARAFQVGFQAYLVKPVDLDELIGVVISLAAR